jgi:hypothetical protein
MLKQKGDEFKTGGIPEDSVEKWRKKKWITGDPPIFNEARLERFNDFYKKVMTPYSQSNLAEVKRLFEAMKLENEFEIGKLSLESFPCAYLFLSDAEPTDIPTKVCTMGSTSHRSVTSEPCETRSAPPVVTNLYFLFFYESFTV